MPEVSLLTDDIRALVGIASQPSRAIVSAHAVQRAVEAYTGSIIPRPEDGEVAPGYVVTALEHSPEGVEAPRLLPASILISNEWQFERPFRVGEEVVLTARLADISERFGGRFGYSIQSRTEIEVADAAGQIIARSVNTLLQYDPADERAGSEE